MDVRRFSQKKVLAIVFSAVFIGALIVTQTVLAAPLVSVYKSPT
jgi:hypothetical protein